MYNAFLHRYLVIELKDTEFMPEYIGKLNFYCSVVDDILCREVKSFYRTPMSGKRQQKEAVGARMLKREEADLDFLENGRNFVEEAEQAAVS